MTAALTARIPWERPTVRILPEAVTAHTLSALLVLEAEGTPEFTEHLAPADAPTPTYDRLTSEMYGPIARAS